MFAKSYISRAKRRGVVLILILGMMGLLALIGVTFATLSGQARINARNFMQAQNTPDASELMDFALSQLIADSGLPTSALRGHSLLRDMYGNDARNNGFLVYSPTTGAEMHIIASTTYVEPSNGMTYLKLCTDIQAPDQNFYGYDFTRWTLRLVYVNGTLGGLMPDGTPLNQTVPPVAQTFEIISDNAVGNDPTYPNSRVFIVARSETTANLQNIFLGSATILAQPPTTGGTLAVPFVLDGRYLRAFNGPGMDGLGVGIARYGNFRVNGNIVNQAYQYLTGASATPVNELLGQTYNPSPGDPDNTLFPGMDEDYDACDLENWFLALQSADGQVVIPSFHRPGILRVDNTFNDWLAPMSSTSATSAAKFLRPRNIDGHNPTSFPNLIPDKITGRIEYDVDNDGDGKTDSVWLDLGYAPRRDASGKLFKPLFAFMVIGLNGRLPLNTVGNLSYRNVFGTPQYTHATHLGNSPSEIDPTWALQNAPAFAIDQFNNTPATHLGIANYFQDQVDNAGTTSPGAYNTGTGAYVPGDGGVGGVSVALTQLRNLLCGTRLYDGGTKNGDVNFAMSQSSAGRVPIFMPNGIADMADSGAMTGAGLTVTRLTNPVPGRWGEAGLIPSTPPPVPPVNGLNPGPLLSPGTAAPYQLNYQTPVTPGLSSWGYVGGTGLTYMGGTGDDNQNSYDVNGESGDVFDPAGAQYAAVERQRRYVTPADVTGDGQILTWYNDNVEYFPPVPPASLYAPLQADTGNDGFGRFSFFKYFRPPGIALTTAVYPPPPAVSPGVGVPILPDLTNNLFHGFEGARNPKLNNPAAPYLINPVVGGMPYNIPPFVAGAPQPPAAGSPTFNQDVFWYYLQGLASANTPPTPFAIGNMNEPDEVNLYDPSSRDQVFGPADLEWLYRQHDSDGASLSSRLAQLAPVSFTNALDGLRRRRLFSLESWETTNFVWANDNPPSLLNALSPTSYVSMSPFAGNARFNQINGASASAGFYNLPGLNTVPGAVPGNPGVFATRDPLRISITPTPNFTYTNPWYVPTPPVAHRDRKINLNFPLPVSNDPKEPVRQKWIRETYQLLKAILPPKAVDTPEELAQLSQFVVNIVDFRDPDCTMTRFVNTDITVTPATATSQAVLSFSAPLAAGTSPITAPSPPFPAGTTQPFDYNPAWDSVNSNYLIQHGMEYPPIAINEVLAFSFKSKQAAGITETPRLFIEVVNTLTESAYPASGPNACDLNLQGWDFVILPEPTTGAGLSRPDPYTGQVPAPVGTTFKSYPVGGDAPISGTVGVGGTATATPFTPLATPVQALRAAGNADSGSTYYYVFASPTPTQVSGQQAETGAPGSPEATLRQEMADELTAAGTGRYFWLYLRRPPNPFDMSYNPSQPNENRVVVDSFRFYYNASTGTVTNPGSSSEVVNQGTEQLYSLQRMQPYRGGHMVAALNSTTNQVAAYGYSEQTTAPPASGPGVSNYYGMYYATNSSGSTNRQITGQISETLGAKNTAVNLDALVSGDRGTDDKWDPLVFHDRDFTSVAELLMVPGCPPGLFTKQFCEQAPPLAPNLAWIASYGITPPTTAVTRATLFPAGQPGGGTGTGTTTPNTPPRFRVIDPTISGGSVTASATVPQPPTFPYLVDNFFYSAVSEYGYPSGLTPPYVGGPSGAGWSKMFEFFEVPSPAIGATGQVAQGNNFDWFRQDRKPGLLNLNLVIDEEVFLGLMGLDSSDNYQQAMLGNSYSKWQLNMFQLTANAAVPQITTQLDSTGNPGATTVNYSYLYSYPNATTVGTVPLGLGGAFAVTNTPNAGDGGNYLKAAFSDFLKITHGGMPYLFGMFNNVPLYRPFRSLSYPDLNSTVMRPAVLPPMPPITAAPTPTTPAVGGSWTAGTWPYTGYTQDPAMKNPYLAAAAVNEPDRPQAPPIQPPPIPTRRLFQIPDAYGPGMAGVNPPFSNASVPGDGNVNNQLTNTNLSNNTYDLTTPGGLSFLGNHNNTVLNPATGTAAYGSLVFKQADMRQHPYFRTEWMQRVMNLTTVRTHQFAVWITVGLFEVTQAGDPQLAATNPALAYDQLGLELGVLEGTNVRYRGFFLLDRTRAVGFNPSAPGDFRDVIVYRKLIE